MNRDELKEYLLNNLPKNPHGRLLLSPRSGKTAIVIDLIKRDEPKKVLWVSPSRKLIDEGIPLEFEKWDAKNFLNRVSFCTFASLHKAVGYYDLIVLDEEQHLTDHNTQNLFNRLLRYEYIISMTGVATKNSDKKDLYERLDLKILYNLPLKKVVKNMVSDYTLNIVRTYMSEKKNTLAKGRYGEYMTSEIQKYSYLNSAAEAAIENRSKDMKFKILARMRAIYDSVSKEEALVELLKKLKGQRNMIFCSSIAQAERLGNGLTFHSKTNIVQLEKFLKEEIKEIFLVNSGGTGFTYKNIDNLIIVQANSDSNGLTTQKIARSLLLQKDYIANIWVLVLQNTKDEDWVKEVIKNFNTEKIEHYEYKPGHFKAIARL
jgi:hypothetical protein